MIMTPFYKIIHPILTPQDSSFIYWWNLGNTKKWWNMSIL